MPTLINTVNPSAQPQQAAVSAPSSYRCPWIPGYSMTLAKMVNEAKEPAAAAAPSSEKLPWIPEVNPSTRTKNFSSPPLANRPLPPSDLPIGAEGQQSKLRRTDRGPLATMTRPTNADVDYRGLPVSQDAEQVFLRLLQSKSADNRRQVLLPKEIRSLSEVLGASHPLGNNQFTPHTVSPEFYLLDASTMNVNGETVLYVEGKLNKQGVLRSYIAIFMDGGPDPETGTGKIEEVSMQGPPENSLHFRKTFKNVVASINWTQGSN